MSSPLRVVAPISKSRQVEPHAAGVGLVDDDIQLVILHRGVEIFLHGFTGFHQ